MSFGHAPQTEEERLTNNEWTSGWNVILAMILLGTWQGIQTATEILYGLDSTNLV